MPIFIDTDNSDPDPENKIFRATRAGNAAQQAEALMKKTIEKIVAKEKNHDFTTLKPPKPNPKAPLKGYIFRLDLSKVTVAAPDTKCEMRGDIIRYPKVFTAKDKSGGNDALSLGMSGSAKASGTGSSAVLDCVEAITEDLFTKSLDNMRLDFPKR